MLLFGRAVSRGAGAGDRGGFVRSVLPFVCAAMLLQGCAQADVPDARNVNVPSPTVAEERRDALNERPDSVMFVPLGGDVLYPQVNHGDPLPDDHVGPFELRGKRWPGRCSLYCRTMTSRWLSNRTRG